MTVGLELAVNYSTIEQVFVITGRGAAEDWTQEELDLLGEIGAIEPADEIEPGAAAPAGVGNAGANEAAEGRDE